MLLPRCEGFLGPAFWRKLRKMKLEAVEIYENSTHFAYYC